MFDNIEVDGDRITSEYPIEMIFPEWVEEENGIHRVDEIDIVRGQEFQIVDENGVYEIKPENHDKPILRLQAFTRSDLLDKFDSFVEEKTDARILEEQRERFNSEE